MDTHGKIALERARSAQVTSVRLTDPKAVVRDPTMTPDEKRAVLASWASDQNAVPDNPALRELKTGDRVGIDDILEALKKLDQMTDDPQPIRQGAGSVLFQDWPTQGRLEWWSDDGDDPLTPAPAAIRPRPPTPEGSVAAIAAAA